MCAAGAENVITSKLIANTGWHNMGTASIGIDGANSVVDEWFRAHDERNLFVVDGRIFCDQRGSQSDSHHSRVGTLYCTADKDQARRRELISCFRYS